MLPSDQDDKEDPKREECNTVVYSHKKGDEHGEPFYIGVGKPSRAYEFGVSRRSTHWHRVKNKYGVYVEILHKNLCRKDALSLEIELIDKYKRINDGGTLVNSTRGGDGAGLGNTNGDRSMRANAYLTTKGARAVRNIATNQIYPSASIAARCLGSLRYRGSISNVCSGKRELYRGEKWVYA